MKRPALPRLSPTALKGLSMLLTVSFVAGGIAIGGGIPVSLADLARNTNSAAQNARAAAANTEMAADNTEALASIAESVKSQLESSERMVATQKEIEAATEENVHRSRDLTTVIRSIRGALADLTEGLSGLSRMATESGTSAEATAAAAARLQATLTSLSARFAVVVEESRELNRKANAYEESGL